MTGGGDRERDGSSTCSCKVGRTAEKYGLGGLDEDLVRAREADASLRDLEQVVNEAVLEAAIRSVDVEVIGSIESILTALTDEETSAGKRSEVRSRLASAGVDAESLESDFVSYQTVRTHLRDCLDIDTSGRGEFTVDDARGTIEWSRTRNVAVIERTLERLRGHGELAAGPLEVSDLVRVTCAGCGSSYPIEDLLARGGCECGG